MFQDIRVKDMVNLKEVADVVCREIEMIQKKYDKIVKSDLIETTLKQGAEEASKISYRKLKKFKRKWAWIFSRHKGMSVTSL